MKNRSFYFFFILLLLGSCLAEQNNELLAPTCHDGIQNQDETEVDCGGRCTACELYTAPCAASLTGNTYTWNDINYTLTTENFAWYDEEDYFEIVIYRLNHTITIHFPSMPTANRIYHASENYYPEGDNACIQLVDGFTGSAFYSSEGDVYTHVFDGIVTAEFCDVTLVDQYFDSQPITGRVTCER